MEIKTVAFCSKYQLIEAHVEVLLHPLILRGVPEPGYGPQSRCLGQASERNSLIEIKVLDPVCKMSNALHRHITMLAAMQTKTNYFRTFIDPSEKAEMKQESLHQQPPTAKVSPTNEDLSFSNSPSKKTFDVHLAEKLLVLAPPRTSPPQNGGHLPPEKKTFDVDKLLVLEPSRHLRGNHLRGYLRGHLGDEKNTTTLNLISNQ